MALKSRKRKKQRKPIDWRKAGIVSVIGLFITLWVGGMLSQFSPAAMLDPDVTFSFKFDPVSCIIANFQNGFSGVLILLLLYACLGAYLFLRRADKERIDTEEDERGFAMENSGVYGTAALMKIDEIKDFCEVEPFSRTTGLVLGRCVPEEGQTRSDLLVSIPPDGKHYKYDALGRIALKKNEETGQVEPVRERLKVTGNRHMAIFGSSGSGKSYTNGRSFILQSIYQGESIIVTDPKGELFSDTAEFAREHGYTVKILNLAYPAASDSWDALSELKGNPQLGIETQNLTKIIISNTTDPGGKTDEAFESAYNNLLSALILYILTAPNYAGPQTLGAIYDLVATKSIEDLQALFNELPENNLARGPWGVFLKGSPNWTGNVISGLGDRLKVLQDEVIKEVLGTPDIDITLPGKAKCAYYVIMSDMNSTFTFISSLFFTSLFNKLVEYSRTLPSQRLPVSVNVIMDEFIAIGRLPDFDKKLATVRSAAINIIMIFQSLTQLQASYPDGLWETLLANCHTIMCLGCNDMTTAEYLSSRSGTATVALENLRVDRPAVQLLSVPSTVSHTYSVGQRPVLLPDEIITLSAENKAIVAIAGANMFLVDKMPYTEIVDANSLKKVNMYEHIPAWAIQKQSRDRINSNSGKDIPDEYQSKYDGAEEQTTAPQPTCNDDADGWEEDESVTSVTGTYSADDGDGGADTPSDNSEAPEERREESPPQRRRRGHATAHKTSSRIKEKGSDTVQGF